MGISPIVGEALAALGRSVVHVRTLGLQQADDSTIVDHALQENLVIVTSDTDLATVVALTGRGGPSVITLRLDNPNATQQRECLTGTVEALGLARLESVLVAVEPGRYRTRRIPIR